MGRKKMQLTLQACGTSGSRLRLCLTAAAETIVRGGHPWVFAESVRDQNRQGAAGELAVIYDRKDKFLAVGLFDPDSPIRVRVFHAGKAQAINRDWWSGRRAQALERRRGLFDERTTGYRLINGERWLAGFGAGSLRRDAGAEDLHGGVVAEAGGNCRASGCA
jgi:hypothetical protein